MKQSTLGPRTTEARQGKCISNVYDMYETLACHCAWYVVLWGSNITAKFEVHHLWHIVCLGFLKPAAIGL